MNIQKIREQFDRIQTSPSFLEGDREACRQLKELADRYREDDRSGVRALVQRAQ